MKKITVVTPCYNEEDNVEQIYSKVRDVFKQIEGVKYEHLFIDNASTDRSVDILREIAASDQSVKLIINARNFGHIRSPHYGLLQADGDAVILMVADFQDPPTLIPTLIEKWIATDADAVLGVKSKSLESPVMFLIRSLYYSLINKLSETKLLKNFMGFGLYDRRLIDALRRIDEPYPYFRGLIFELTDRVEVIEYTQAARKRGITKNNFYTLYDLALLGICSHSKVPLRIATWLGFTCSILSVLTAVFYGVYKLFFWESFAIGVAPLVIGMFFFSAVQLFFIGVIGEYLGSIHTKVSNRPLVVERERVNF
ncbi:MAG: glycosyltransferase involved in cell wall biosynthesis [Candidatus Azotimanducaceae bacterium]